MKRSIESPKSFGVSVGVVCGLVSALEVWRGRPTVATVFGIISAGLLSAACTAPSILTGPSRVWWKIARTLAWINTRILLSLLFLLVFTPVGFVFRLIGRDGLDRRWRGGSRGWNPYSDRVRSNTHYEHMF